MARPNPCAPPVTTAQRPFRSILFMGEILSLQFGGVVAAAEVCSLARSSRGEGRGKGLSPSGRCFRCGDIVPWASPPPAAPPPLFSLPPPTRARGGGRGAP